MTKKEVVHSTWEEEIEPGNSFGLNVVTTDEFELHDVVSHLYHLKFACNKRGENVDKVVLKPTGYDYEKTHYFRWNKKKGQYMKVKMPKPRKIHGEISKRNAKRLEKKVNDLLKQMHELDVFLHEVAEYTC